MARKGITVTALKYHTFGPEEYNEGDVYEVFGDETQTAEQYVHTLEVIGFATQGEVPKKAKDPEQTYKTRDLKAKR